MERQHKNGGACGADRCSSIEPKRPNHRLENLSIGAAGSLMA
ncbi:MAG: hypothetical protein R3E58_15960 [Phycisphaerae bacterium]